MNNAKARLLLRDLSAGCGDHSCLLRPPQGMGTNGGCRCHNKILDAFGAELGARLSPERLRGVAERITEYTESQGHEPEIVSILTEELTKES